MSMASPRHEAQLHSVNRGLNNDITTSHDGLRTIITCFGEQIIYLSWVMRVVLTANALCISIASLVFCLRILAHLSQRLNVRRVPCVVSHPSPTYFSKDIS